MLCMLMLFSASEMWAGTTFTVDVKCEPTGVAKVYAKHLDVGVDAGNYNENQETGGIYFLGMVERCSFNECFRYGINRPSSNRYSALL